MATYPAPTTPKPMAKLVRFRRSQLRVAVIMFEEIHVAEGMLFLYLDCREKEVIRNMSKYGLTNQIPWELRS